ncbi:MAG: alpha/beta fold hydrolase [Candidatus Omnitrophota bacterium]
MAITDNKTGIVYRKWEAAGTRAVFLLVHGLGSYGGRWQFLAEFFQRGGITSYAIDLRGFGETPELKGHIDSFGTYFHDIKTLHAIIKKEYPGKKIFLAGESMGGLIAFLCACLNPGLFDGLVCLAPAFKNRLKAGFFDYLRMFFYRVFNPRKQMRLPFTAEMCTRDPGYRRVMDTDKREIRSATPVLLVNILLAEARVNSLKEKLTGPVLFQIAVDLDNFVDPGGTEKIFRGLKITDKKIFRYPSMLHSLSVDLGREEVFNDILNWVNERV